nr:hypothetical protein [uncultured Massilia sp.]
MNTTDKLAMLPIQDIAQDDGVILKRGAVQTLIPGSDVLLVLRVVQKALRQAPRSSADLQELFAAPARPLVASLLDHLVRKGFLVAHGDAPAQGHESPQDIFYWHFNKHQADVARVLNDTTWLFAGINRLNGLLLQALEDEGLDNYAVVDDPMLRDAAAFGDDQRLLPGFWAERAQRIVAEDEAIDAPGRYGFVVAASEFGSAFLLERWNAFAVARLLSGAVAEFRRLCRPARDPAGDGVLRLPAGAPEFAQRRLRRAPHRRTPCVPGPGDRRLAPGDAAGAGGGGRLRPREVQERHPVGSRHPVRAGPAGRQHDPPQGAQGAALRRLQRSRTPSARQHPPPADLRRGLGRDPRNGGPP